MAKIFIGTSGFTYKHWKKVFYPEDLPEKDWLKFYSQKFNSVEINSSFYHLIKAATYQRWYNETPADFAFVLKGSRYITHLQRLKTDAQTLDNFLVPAKNLKEKLNCILWQLPSSLHANENILANFCKLLKSHKIAKNLRHAFEFRHQSWFNQKIYSLLRTLNFALTIAHSNRWPVVIESTADYVYFRFHGSELYSSSYSSDELKNWAVQAKKFLKTNKDLYAFFNNDARGFATKNAFEFRELIK